MTCNPANYYFCVTMSDINMIEDGSLSVIVTVSSKDVFDRGDYIDDEHDEELCIYLEQMGYSMLMEATFEPDAITHDFHSVYADFIKAGFISSPEYDKFCYKNQDIVMENNIPVVNLPQTNCVLQKISTKIIRENIPNWLDWNNDRCLENYFDNEITILCKTHNSFDELCKQFNAKSQDEIKAKALKVWTNSKNWKREEKIKLNNDENEYDYSCSDFGRIFNLELFNTYRGEEEVFVNSGCIKRTYINEKFALGDWRLEILSSPNDDLIAFTLIVD